MQILEAYKDLPESAKGAVIVIGNFDGVHRGHAVVISEAKQKASDLSAPLGVMSFEPHPREFFAPDAPPFRLTTNTTRARLLEGHGVDILYQLPFNAALAGKPAEDFVRDVLHKGLGARHVVVGYDFCFGKGRKGDAQLLRQMGDALGFGVTIVEPVTPVNESDVYSSTRIRDALREGRPDDAAQLLGHWWTVEGVVQPGDQRGRTIGFPTANLTLGRYLHPAYGVYAALATVYDGPHKGIYNGVANLGRRPTFDAKDVLLETFLFDFDGDLYGADMGVSLLTFLRPEMKFGGLDELKAQIANDTNAARAIHDELATGRSLPWTERE